MELQPPIRYDPEKFSTLNFGSILLPTDEYTTSVTNFPATYALKDWGEKGNFFVSINIFSDGAKLAEIHSSHIDESGYFNINISDYSCFLPPGTSGVIHSQYYHPKGIPVELYYSHVHKKTGAYVAYPAAAFMGDEIYVNVHAQQLENTLFWPGVVTNPHIEESIAVLNPYKLSYSYQLSLFLPNKQRIQTPVFRVKPFSHRIHSIEECFPKHYEEIRNSAGKCSICIAAQYKVVAFMMIKNRDANVITTVDHLHSYCLV